MDEATRIAKLREEKEILKKRLSGQSKGVTREIVLELCACAWTYVLCVYCMKGMVYSSLIMRACVLEYYG